jgi:nucleotide-binding universal stress UspA family protein
MAGSPDDARKRESLAAGARQLTDAGMDVSAELLPGDPERVIVEQIEAFRADLLVMGAYGHTRIRDMIIGSTTTALLRSAPIPVLMHR